MFFNIRVLESLSNFTKKHLYLTLFLIKLEVWRAVTLIKRDYNTSFFRRNFRLFKNIFFYRKPLVATSIHLTEKSSTQIFRTKTLWYPSDFSFNMHFLKKAVIFKINFCCLKNINFELASFSYRTMKMLPEAF